MDDAPKLPAIRHYLVDEAGDPMLFNRKKRLIVGNEGSSRYFILGKVDIDDPSSVMCELESLRQRLLADPYFQGVPSMQPERKKTVLGFHAKDDLPEVRREVFKLLCDAPIKFYAVVRDKKVIAQGTGTQSKESKLSISSKSAI